MACKFVMACYGKNVISVTSQSGKKHKGRKINDDVAHYSTLY